MPVARAAHVGESTGQRGHQAQSGASVGHHHILKHQLEDAAGEKGEYGQGVVPAVAEEVVVGAQKADDAVQAEKGDDCQQKAEQCGA